MKISIIGAGNVGSALADRILANNLADVTLIDIAEGLAGGKALDLQDASPVMGYKRQIVGTESFDKVAGSQVVVITAGFARKPGMSRDDLINKNAEVVRSVLKCIKEFSTNTIIVMVTNPLDVLTYLAHREFKIPRASVFGMAGNLDTARFKVILSESLGAPPEKIETCVLGSHGDTMVPLVSKTTIGGKPLEKLLDKAAIAEIIEKTKKRGSEIVALLKSGSAYFSPSAACYEILESIVNDGKKIIPCSCVVGGEYGISDCAIGVPAEIGKHGIRKVHEWKLSDNELAALRNSAQAVKDVLKKLS